MLVQFKEDYLTAHATIHNDNLLGSYNMIHQISTKEELPNTYFCMLPVSTNKINKVQWQNSIYEVLYIVSPLFLDREVDDQKMSKFKREIDKTKDTDYLYYKVITFVNNHCVYAYLPISTVREIP